MVRQVHRRREESPRLFESSSSTKVLEEELSWFFTEAESAAALPSNFSAVEGTVSGWSGIRVRADLGADARMEAACAAATIRKRLLAMKDRDAGVLLAAFAPRAWPEELEEQLGRLTGIVVRIVAARGPEPTSAADLTRREEEAARSLDEALAREAACAVNMVRLDAHGLYTRALRAYATVRGLGPTVVPGRE